MAIRPLHTHLASFKTLTLAVAVTTVLSACGGSDDASDSIKHIAPIPTSTSFMLQGDDTSQVSIGQPIGLVAVSTMDNKLENPYYSWQVTSGNADAVKISANHQPATSVSITDPGDYVITLLVKANASDSDADAIEKIEKVVTVVAGSASKASLKVDRAAATGGSVSLYFEPSVALNSADDWTLTQISGTSAKEIRISQDGPFAQVLLPDVTKDELLVFEAIHKSDPSVKDTAYILVKPNPVKGKLFCNSPDDYDSCWPVQPLNHHYAYQPTTQYADNIVDCVISSKLSEDEDFCTIEDLPIIALDNDIDEVPTIEQIMSRVVVTHDWMGKNFEQFLREVDKNDDFKKLLRSTTAIVISEDIKPSMYLTGPGAIYLDANFLWLTPDERDTVTQTVDHRSGFGNKFDYFFDYDYEKDSQSMFSNWSEYNPPRDTGRSMETISMNLVRLMYHELGHAGDFQNYSYLQNVVKPNYENIKTLHNWEILPDAIVSDVLTTKYPLESKILLDMGQVLFWGKEPTETQLSYTGTQIANMYLGDHANDSYSYSTNREDLAMLFEESMMLLRYDMNRYVMVMDRNEASGERPVVIKGERNRIAKEGITNRADFVVEQVLPEVQNLVNAKVATTENVDLCPDVTYGAYFNTNCDSINPYIAAASYDSLVRQGLVDSEGRPKGMAEHDHEHDMSLLHNQHKAPSSITK